MSVQPLAPGAVDCHVHVLDPLRFPFDPEAPYVPVRNEWASAEQLAAVLDAHGLSRVVIVDPTSAYDGDSRCMIDAVERLGTRARGIARWSPRRPAFDAAALARLGRSKVVGVRADFIGDGLAGVSDGSLDRLVRLLADHDFVLDVQCEQEQICELSGALAQVPVRIVVDHMGRLDPSKGIAQPAFEALCRLLDRGDVYVKLSGPMRSAGDWPWHEIDPLVDALLCRFGANVAVWGSDWPFLRASSRIDYGPLLRVLERWLPDPTARQQVLAVNPCLLFGFPAM